MKWYCDVSSKLIIVTTDIVELQQPYDQNIIRIISVNIIEENHRRNK